MNNRKGLFQKQIKNDKKYRISNIMQTQKAKGKKRIIKLLKQLTAKYNNNCIIMYQKIHKYGRVTAIKCDTGGKPRIMTVTKKG